MQNSDSIFNKHSTTGTGFPGKALDTYKDLLIVLGLAIILLVFIYVPFLSHNVIRFALGLVMVLFLPGYAFIAALYPGKEDLGNLERAVLSVGLSIILVPFTGYILNYTIWGITLNSILLSVTALLLVCLLVAFVRRQWLPAEKRFMVDFRGPVEQAKKLVLPASKDRSDTIISGLLICSLLLILSVIGYLVVMPYQADRYTEFYLYGPEGKMSNYPTNFTLGEKKPLIIGIVNKEGMSKEYDLAVTLTDGNQSHRIFLDHMVLADNETLEKTIYLAPDRVGNMQNMRFLLYMEGSPADPYRECNLWVNVTEPAVNASVSNETTVTP
ncbi:conserved hypothetical protein [Methanocella arvoryzae MRE50]|uniref:DUF1616 domain-containing protein n=2 Tax=Methanocella TaxID=570266 RepID=Q0W3D2_METAR|nr:conserved hypothetical protein [Methanocella arvoryzae MRE50]